MSPASSDAITTRDGKGWQGATAQHGGGDREGSGDHTHGADDGAKILGEAPPIRVVS